MTEERDPLDRFYTPPPLAEACLRWLTEHLGAGGHLYEPAAGGGAWMAAADALGWTVEGCDIDPEAPAVVEGWAVLSPMDAWTPRSGPGWWITNPPYGPVDAWIELLRARAAARGDHGVALLMRLTAIEWLMSMEDRPHFLGTTDQRARWGGVGGEKYTSGDSCGAVLAVWRGPEMLRQGEATRCWPIPEWRPRGRTRRVG